MRALIKGDFHDDLSIPDIKYFAVQGWHCLHA